MEIRKPIPKKNYTYVAPSKVNTKIEVLQQINQRLEQRINNMKEHLNRCINE